MRAETILYFDSFGFDGVSGKLTRDGVELPLGRTAAKVLSYLVSQRHQAVTPAEIQQAVWPSQVVERGAVKGYVSDLRALLRDDPRASRLIASVDGGYRFIATVSTWSPSQRAAQRAVVVGRAESLQRLRGVLDLAWSGTRQFIFVTGEAGIGKTTVVETLVMEAEAERTLLMGRGQCVEHAGAGMAYLPVLEALERLGRGEMGHRVLDLLGRHAPTWLVHLSSLLPPDEVETLQRRIQGATQERMFRELAVMLEALTEETPLILWLEDLHWCDFETVALLSYLARRTESARLCIVGTYRPVEVILQNAPVKTLAQELHAGGKSEELLLPFLDAAAIEEYVQRRFMAGADLSLPELTQAIVHRSEGNPLFMVRMLDYAIAQGAIAQREGQWRVTATKTELETLLPTSLRELIARQTALLTEGERRVLEAASVVGEEFTLEEVTAALEVSSEEVEQCCETLAARQLVQFAETEQWPDGTVTVRARFGHALYRHATYEQLLPSRKLRWHGRIGARKERAHGEKTEPIAAELAEHFARAGHLSQAARYYAQAGQFALRQNAYQVATEHVTRGLALLGTLSDSPERAQLELPLQMTLGVALMAVKGFAAPEIEQAYARARELCRQQGDTPQLFPALYGLWSFHLTRTELHTAQTLGEQLLQLAQVSQEPTLLLHAHIALEITFFFQGELLAAHEHLQQALALYNPPQHRSLAVVYGHDPGVVSLGYLALTVWLFGFPDQALHRSRELAALARACSYAPSLSSALHFTALLHNWRWEGHAAQRHEEEVLTLATEQSLPYWMAAATVGHGWSLVTQRQNEAGATQIRQGLDSLSVMGATLGFSCFRCVLAEASGNMGRTEEGLGTVAEALEFVSVTGERWYEAELYRVKGELLLRQVKMDSGESQVKRSKRKAKSKNDSSLAGKTRSA